MTYIKSDTIESDNIVEKYISGLKEFYPGFRFSSSQGIDSTAFELELAFNDQTIKNTEYELSGDNNLIHYTSSIQNVIEILYSGNLRMKNLIALNDPQEMSFIINHLELESYKAYIENFKTTYFSASFCKVEDYEKADEFPMWRLYGGDGFGCAIVFEIEKHDSYWNHFIIGQVQYGDNRSLKKFNEFMKFHNSFKQTNNFPMNVPLVFPAIMAFHKNEIWNYEKEVRLLTHQNYDEYTLKSTSEAICELKHVIDKNNKIHSYVELPIKGGGQYNSIVDRNGNHVNILNKQLPILKIKKIILGYNVKPELIYELRRLIGYISINIYNYEIDIELSHLRKFMI